MAETNDQDRKYTLNEALGLITQHIIGNVSYSTPSRARLSRVFSDPRRDIDDEVGYKKTDELTIDDYKDMYDRNPVAARVVEIMPKESWIQHPTVYEDEDPDVSTDFEEAWDSLGNSLMGSGFYGSESGSVIWSHLLDADIKSGIGHYGGILLGIDDGRPLSEPADGIDEMGQPTKSPQRKLMYVKTLDQSCMDVIGWQQDVTNPRYGMPTMYSITTGNQFRSGQLYVSPSEMRTLHVHWSRVIHLAESGDIWAIPRMRPVYNRLCDIAKVCGSSSEMYYKGAFPGYSLEMLPELILAGYGKDQTSAANENAIKDAIENWQNGLQRVLKLVGYSMKGLAPQVVDPTAATTLYIKIICIYLAIPERIFMGSERGELASSQDKGSWSARMAARQRNYLTPRVIVPFVNRLIMLGVLPRPEKYFVQWPNLLAMTPAEKADVALKRMDVLSKYVQGGIGDNGLMQPLDLLTRELDYDEAEAQEILDAASEYKDDRQEEIDVKAQEDFDRQIELAETIPPEDDDKTEDTYEDADAE